MIKISYRAARVNAGLTMVEAKEKLGIGLTMLCEYEKGTSQPKAEIVRRMAILYGCSVSDFKEMNTERGVENEKK